MSWPKCCGNLPYNCERMWRFRGKDLETLELFVHSVAKKLFCPPAKFVGAALLQHLTSCFWKLEGHKAAGRQRPRGEQDGHGFGYANKGGEDADPQHGR